MKKRMSLQKKGLNINTYGYTYSKGDFFGSIVVLLVLAALVSYLHKLQPMYMAIVMITVCCLLPLFITSYFKYKHEKLKFEEYCQYFEYMKLYFKTYKKIKIALENVLVLFEPTSNMYKCIQKAIQEINTTGDYKRALSCIDKEYHNSYLERLHNLFIVGEQQGSDSVYENLDLINYNQWKDDIASHQNSKKYYRYILYFITVICLGISLFMVFILEGSLDQIFTDPKYQMYTLIEIELIFLLFSGVYVSLVNKKWIRSDD